MKPIEVIIYFGTMPCTINIEQIAYVAQNNKGNALVVMSSGHDIELKEEYGNFMERLKDEIARWNKRQ